ncbi:MAG: PmoA family protein [Pirellulales bacterium]
MFRTLRCAFVVLSSTLSFLAHFPTSLYAAEAVSVTIDAGMHDRNETIVRVPTKTTLPLGALTLKDEAGKSYEAQISAASNQESGSPRQELIVLIPQLAAGKSLALSGEAGKPSAEQRDAYKFTDVPRESISLSYGPTPVWKYMDAPLDDKSRETTYKVFHHLYSPDGKRIVTKGPGGQFTHHRGLFYGFNKVNYGPDLKTQVDIWHCTKDTHQSHERVVYEDRGALVARHELEIAWHGVNKEIFAVERRELIAYHMPGGNLIEFISVVTPKEGTMKVDGDPQHAGFHFRASNDVSEKTKAQTYYLRPDGKDKPGATRNWDPKKADPKTVNLAWNAMSFVLPDEGAGERRYSVGYLDHPGNPKEARYSERDYGRFGSYFEAAATPEKPLRVNYRIWLQDGETTLEAMQARSRDFVEPPTATWK